jgi:hypothetical protein
MKKIGAFITVPEENKVDTLFIETTTAAIRKSLMDKLPKGWAPYSPIKIRMGISGDDFIKNQFTVVGEYKIVRVPRIISRKYYKNKRH